MLFCAVETRLCHTSGASWKRSSSFWGPLASNHRTIHWLQAADSRNRALKCCLRVFGCGHVPPLLTAWQLTKMIFNGLRLASRAPVDQFAFDGSSDRLLPEGSDLRRAIIRRLALGLIRLYQIHVSPRKGFNCPYRELHGELSCSSYVSRLLQTESSFSAVFSESFKRFQDCAGASTQLASQSPRMRCWVVPCCLP